MITTQVTIQSFKHILTCFRITLVYRILEVNQITVKFSVKSFVFNLYFLIFFIQEKEKEYTPLNPNVFPFFLDTFLQLFSQVLNTHFECPKHTLKEANISPIHNSHMF